MVTCVLGNKVHKVFVEIQSCANKGNKRDLFEGVCSVILLGFEYSELRTGII